MPFYQHKMSMIGGLLLSGDHFHKIGKVIRIAGERGFVGLYTVMNCSNGVEGVASASTVAEESGVAA
jgi:hypothetical protein